MYGVSTLITPCLIQIPPLGLPLSGFLDGEGGGRALFSEECAYSFYF